MIRIAIALLLIVALPCKASAANCSLTEQQWLGNELDHLKSWAAIHESFRKYTPQCDDGFFAEGYSDAVVVQLARRWSTLTELNQISQRDPTFRGFVLKHIDATTDSDDLKAVATNASTRCPKVLKTLCTDIENAAKQAIKDL